MTFLYFYVYPFDYEGLLCIAEGETAVYACIRKKPYPRGIFRESSSSIVVLECTSEQIVLFDGLVKRRENDAIGLAYGGMLERKSH